MNDLARRAFPGLTSEHAASELVYQDRGRMIAFQTATALYYGELRAIIFHVHGSVGLSIQNGETKADATVEPGQVVLTGPLDEGRPR